MPSEIVAVAYETTDRADAALAYVREQEAANQLALDEVAVVVCGEDGEMETRLDERPLTDGVGRGVAGALVGGIIGTLLGPLGVVAGFAAGGVLGAESGSAHEIHKSFLAEIRSALAPGTSAIVVAGTPGELTWLSGHVPDQLRGRVVRTTLSDEQLARLRENAPS